MDSEAPTKGPRRRIAPGVGQVNEELEVGFDADFELRWHAAQRVGRVILAIIVLAALAGLLGEGPLDHASVGTMRDGGVVNYQPIARFGTTTQITVHLPPGTTSFRIDSAFIEPMGLETIVPQPVLAKPDGGGTVLSFKPVNPTIVDLVRLRGKPSQIGPIPVTIVIGDSTIRRWTEFVLP